MGFDVGNWTAGAGAEVDDFPAVVFLTFGVRAFDHPEDVKDYGGG